MYASDSNVQCLHLNLSYNLLHTVVLFQYRHVQSYWFLLFRLFSFSFSFSFRLLFSFFIFLCRPCNVRLVTLKDLLEANADPNIADSAGRTALSWAVTNPSGMLPSALCGVKTLNMPS